MQDTTTVIIYALNLIIKTLIFLLERYVDLNYRDIPFSYISKINDMKKELTQLSTILRRIEKDYWRF